MEKRKTVGMTDMTVGHPGKLILLFSLPLLAGNILQQAYNMVDSIVVGNYVGKEALAAVGTAFPIIFLLISVFMGLGIGATIMVSQFYGAGDMDRVKRTVDTIYKGLLWGAVPLTILGMLISGPVLRLINVPDDTYPLAHLYSLIIFAGIIGNLGYNANAGILQGLGDSKTPLLFLAIACVMNIVLDILFVVGFHWGVAGVALATIISQFFSWIFGIFYINQKYPDIHLNLFQLKFDKELFQSIIRLGVPAGAQQALFSVGIMVMTSLVNSHGSDFMAGFNGANKLDTFAFMPIQSFGTAATTFVGQNIGAGRLDRVKTGVHWTLFMSCGFSIFVAALLVPAAPTMMRLFNQEPQVIAAGVDYLRCMMPWLWMLAIMFTLSSIMRGAGEMMIPMVTSIISLWLARVPAAYLINAVWGKEFMFYSYPVGWVLGLAIVCPAYFKGRWREKSVVHRGESGFTE